MTYNFPQYSRNADQKYGPTSRSHFYIPVNYHSRKASSSPHKTKWIIKENEQYEVFRIADESEWECDDNRIEYLKWLGLKLGYHKPDDWYNIRIFEFDKNHGGACRKIHKGSPSLTAMELYPDYDWKPWLFKSGVPKMFWDDRKNRLLFMEWLRDQLNYSSSEDWYQISKGSFISNNGAGLLIKFNTSPSDVVMDYLPDIDWKPWLFRLTPNWFWPKKQNRFKYLAWLAERLSIMKPEDWYSVTQKDFVKNHGGGLLSRYRQSPALLITEHFPNFNWEIERFSYGKKRQKHLFKIVKRRFKDDIVHWEFKHPKLRYSESNVKMELDIYIPSCKIAIEYQGEQHYLPVEVFGGLKMLEVRQKLDEEKRIRCKEMGILLIEIPYTWDGTKRAAIEAIDKSIEQGFKN